MAAPKVPSSHAYLLDAPTLTLATIAPDGRPQLSQTWFLAEDGVVKIALNTRAEGQEPRGQPARRRCSSSTPPIRRSTSRSAATPRSSPIPTTSSPSWMCAKYGSPPIREWDGPDGKRVEVTINPVRINAVDMGGAEPTDA